MTVPVKHLLTPRFTFISMRIFAVVLSSSAPDDTIKYDTIVAAIFRKLEVASPS